MTVPNRAGPLGSSEVVGSHRVALGSADFEATRVRRHPVLILGVLVTTYDTHKQVDWSRVPVRFPSGQVNDTLARN